MYSFASETCSMTVSKGVQKTSHKITTFRWSKQFFADRKYTLNATSSSLLNFFDFDTPCHRSNDSVNVAEHEVIVFPMTWSLRKCCLISRLILSILWTLIEVSPWSLTKYRTFCRVNWSIDISTISIHFRCRFVNNNSSRSLIQIRVSKNNVVANRMATGTLIHLQFASTEWDPSSALHFEVIDDRNCPIALHWRFDDCDLFRLWFTGRITIVIIIETASLLHWHVVSSSHAIPKTGWLVHKTSSGSMRQRADHGTNKTS